MKNIQFFLLAAGHWLRKIIYLTLSLCLGGDECLVCGRRALTPLCPSCRDKRLLTWEGAEGRCKTCGKPLISEAGLCMECRKREEASPVELCFPVFSYRLWMKDLLFAWKTQGVRLLSPLFARIIAEVIGENFGDNMVIVPVPPRPGKLRRKGWDQVEDLCRWLDLAHRMPVLRLLRRRSAVQQKKLTRDERSRNAQAAYYVPDSIRDKIDRGKIPLPRRVLLLDDVRTTGVTLETCAGALKALGVERVSAVALAGVN
ncbi:MAG: ComF family protein [Spirochaetaceae bacterium]|jgi:ComF family protein|nr:ComF family protein [Spirochaetaceae bacterium]